MANEEDVWIKVPKILAISGIAVQELKHKLRLVVGKVNLGVQSKENQLHIARDSEESLLILATLKLVKPRR